MLSQSPAAGLVPPYDDENVPVDENHEKERSEEETGVLAAESQLADEIRPAFRSLNTHTDWNRLINDAISHFCC